MHVERCFAEIATKVGEKEAGLRACYRLARDSLDMKLCPEATPTTAILTDEIPLNVKEAAAFLGVSRQTVYAWVERKQIPHLRVMGRNIRFLKSELVSFRASFKQEMENE